MSVELDENGHNPADYTCIMCGKDFGLSGLCRECSMDIAESKLAAMSEEEVTALFDASSKALRERMEQIESQRVSYQD